jgi:hypothetical protein
MAILSVVLIIAPAPVTGVGLRWSRAVAVATTAWSTASAAHLLTGGHLPAVPVVIALIALTAWPLTFSLRGPASRIRLVALLSTGQAAMHTAFVLIGAWSVAAPVASAHPGSAHVMPGMMPAVPPASGHAMSLLPSPMMVFAHLGAAVLLGCALSTGERALFSLLGLLVQLARPILRGLAQVLRVLAGLLIGAGPSDTATTTATRRRDDVVSRLPRHVLVCAVLWRGPPRLLPSSH